MHCQFFIHSDYIKNRDDGVLFYARDVDVEKHITPTLKQQGFKVEIRRLAVTETAGFPPAPKEKERTEGWHDWIKNRVSAGNGTIVKEPIDTKLNAPIPQEISPDAGDRGPIKRTDRNLPPTEHLERSRKSFFLLARRNRKNLGEAAASLEDAVIKDREPYHKR